MGKSKISDKKNSNEENFKENNDYEILKEKITSYFKIDDLIKEKREEIKELNNKKMEYDEFLKEFLENFHLFYIY